MSDEITRAVGRIEGKQDMALSLLKKMDERVSENEKEINSLKNKAAWWSGASGALAFIAAKFSDLINFG
jgi:ABC-type Fe3+-hydroxamate transport system substrate-binding protein